MTLNYCWMLFMNFTKTNKADLTQDLIAKVLKYDPISGTLVWISNLHSKRVVPGSRAGCLVKGTGYRTISLFGRSYPEHILIWFIYYGVWPSGQIDHENQVRDDNRISNLRDITKAENARNRSRNPHSKLGEHGIWFNSRTNRYVAEITMNGKKVYQKSFVDIDEAIIQRKAKSLELGFHENHGSQST